MAVYTLVSSKDLKLLLKQYNIGQLKRFTGIVEGVENSNYILVTTSGTYILTIFEKRVKTRDIPYFLSLLNHLNKHNIKCPLPIKRSDGNILSTIKNKKASVFTYLEGSWSKNPNIKQCELLGTNLAKLHNAGKNFNLKRKNNLGNQQWGSMLLKASTNAERLQKGLYREINLILKIVLSQWPKNLPIGNIHADLFPDNVFFMNNRVSGIIDFYFSCNDFYAYDIAICINSWCFENNINLNFSKLSNFINSYNYVRPLNINEVQALPVLMAGASIRFLLTRLIDYSMTTKTVKLKIKDPHEYLIKLRYNVNSLLPNIYGAFR